MFNDTEEFILTTDEQSSEVRLILICYFTNQLRNHYKSVTCRLLFGMHWLPRQLHGGRQTTLALLVGWSTPQQKLLLLLVGLIGQYVSGRRFHRFKPSSCFLILGYSENQVRFWSKLQYAFSLWFFRHSWNQPFHFNFYNLRKPRVGRTVPCSWRRNVLKCILFSLYFTRFKKIIIIIWVLIVM